jgi:hypothetical protein
LAPEDETNRLEPRNVCRATSVQDAIAALNGKLHQHFNWAGCAGFKLPLQESFDGQFAQFSVGGALEDFDFVHQAVLGINRLAKDDLCLSRHQRNWEDRIDCISERLSTRSNGKPMLTEINESDPFGELDSIAGVSQLQND